MKELFFDPRWSYRELTLNLKTLRNQYRDILAFFSYFQSKEKIRFIKQTKKAIYSYPFKEYLCNFAWNYLIMSELQLFDYNIDFSDEIDETFIDEIINK